MRLAHARAHKNMFVVCKIILLDLVCGVYSPHTRSKRMQPRLQISTARPAHQNMWGEDVGIADAMPTNRHDLVCKNAMC